MCMSGVGGNDGVSRPSSKVSSFGSGGGGGSTWGSSGSSNSSSWASGRLVLCAHVRVLGDDRIKRGRVSYVTAFTRVETSSLIISTIHCLHYYIKHRLLQLCDT